MYKIQFLNKYIYVHSVPIISLLVKEGNCLSFVLLGLTSSPESPQTTLHRAAEVIFCFLIQSGRGTHLIKRLMSRKFIIFYTEKFKYLTYILRLSPPNLSETSLLISQAKCTALKAVFFFLIVLWTTQLCNFLVSLSALCFCHSIIRSFSSFFFCLTLSTY